MNNVRLGLRTRNLGTPRREMTNPFTGEKFFAYTDDGATAEEFSAGEAILDAAGASPPDPDGFRRIDFGSDCRVHVNLGRSGGEIEVVGLTHDAMDLVFQLATASGRLVTSTIDPDTVAVLPGQHHAGIDKRFPLHDEVGSAEALLDWVQAGLHAGRIA